MEVICRTCLCSNTNSFNIFEHNFNNRSVLDMLTECVAVKVEIDDGFPHTICCICLEKLVSASEFKLMVKKCDLKLRNFYKNDINESSIEIVEESDFLLSIENFPVTKNKVDMIQASSEIFHANSNITESVEKELMPSEDLRININNQNDLSVVVQNISSNANYKNDHNQQAVSKKKIVFDKTDVLLQKNNYKSDLSVINNFKNIVANNQYVSIIESNKKLISHRDNIELQSFDISDHENEEISLNMSLTSVNDKYLSNLSETNLEKENPSADLNVSSFNVRKTALNKKKQNRNRLICKYCNKSFSFRHYFDTHIHQHTGNIPYKCEVCNKSYAKQYALNQHKRTHSNTKAFLCGTCGKGFKLRCHLQSHMETHSEERLHKCNICNKSFKQRNTLIIHLKIHNEENQDICEICGKSFRSTTGLYKHRKIHSIDKPVNCPTCGKCFVTKISLQRHIKRHSNNKPYACSKCEKRFSVNTSLQRHILIHTGEKPYSCNICGKAFRQRACIPRHMRIHTGETPFSCELCPLKFKYKHHLLNHMKVHV